MNGKLREAVEELERRLETQANAQRANSNFGRDCEDPDIASSMGLFAEHDVIDGIGDMVYHEKLAFNLEHMAGITCLIEINMPTIASLTVVNGHSEA